MTVILALKSREGLVLATDSQATQQLAGGVPVKLDAVKIAQHENHILWAGTGAEGCNQRVELNLTSNRDHIVRELPISQVGNILHQCGNAVQKASTANFVQYARDAQVEAWGGIFCGWVDEGPFIVEVDLNGGWQFHSEMAATGSGYAFALLAMGSVKHHNVAARSLEHAKAIAYRAIEMTCEVSAFGVGLPVQLGVVTEEGASILGKAELDALEETVNLWKSQEVDALGEALAGDAEAEPDDENDPGLDAPDAGGADGGEANGGSGEEQEAQS